MNNVVEAMMAKKTNRRGRPIVKKPAPKPKTKPKPKKQKTRYA